MKRKVSILLVLTMVLTFIPFSSFAQQDFDKQLKEAIVKSKKLFNIGDEYDKFEHDISSYDGNAVFYLNWSDSKKKLGNIDVSITVDGIVLSYGKWKPYYGDYKPKLPKVSKEEGFKIAKDFIKKVNPEFANNIKYIENNEILNPNSDSYNYYFVRTVNGIPFTNNNIDISVDNTTGEVKNYYSNWDLNIVFPDEKDIISLEKAKELYKEKIGLNLLCKSSFNYELDGRKSNIYLAYGPLNTYLGINAKDEEVTFSYDYYRAYAKDMGGSDFAKEGELNPDEKEAVDSITGLISKEEAEKIGRELLKIDSEYKITNIGLHKNRRNNDDYVWDINFEKGSGTKQSYAGISIDAKTKEIVQFNKYSYVDPNKKVQYKEEEALKIAKEYIAKINPDKAKLIEYKKNYDEYRPLEEDERTNYTFEFIRREKDAYVTEDGITVSVDTRDGSINEYRISWGKDKLPSQDKVIPIDKAYDILFNDIGMELKYINPDRYSSRYEDNKREAVLVYGLKNEKPANIDAKAGTILNYQGKPFKKPTVVSYSDIEKSYAKEKINILAQYGIALPGNEFKPSDKITQRDFLYLLAKANSPYIEINKSDDVLYNNLINVGIVKEDERAPEKIVTKEEAIKYIIRALKYDKVADLTEIYTDLFKDTKDISPELKGYASIAYGFKIVQGSNGYLKPKAEIKREDGANMIYNYLFSN